MAAVKVFTNARVFTSAPGDDKLYSTLVTRGDSVVYVGDEKGANDAIEKVRAAPF
jgi:predicted amidohydrolase YtcJ